MSKTKRKHEKKKASTPGARKPESSKKSIRLLLASAGGVLLGLAITAIHHSLFLSSAPSLARTSEKVAAVTKEAPGPAPDGMVWIPGGTFWMGSDDIAIASPVHKVTLDGFWMDKTEVTNAEFKRFVEATGYVTRFVDIVALTRRVSEGCGEIPR